MTPRWWQGGAAIRLKQRYHALRDEAERAVLARADELLPNVCPVCGAKNPAALTNPLGGTWAECPNDGTVYADPVPSEAALELLQNDPSQAYPFLKGRAVADAKVAAHHDELLALERILPAALGPKTRLLDVGCGTGGLLLAARTRCEAKGVELHAAAVEVAWRHGLDVKHGRFEALTPFGQFDVISFVCVLEHAAQPKRLLEVARRWLAPGGHVYVVTPNVGSVSFARFRERHSHLSSASNVSLFTRDGLRSLAERNGYRVAQHALTGGRDVSLSDLVTSAVVPGAFRHRMSAYRPSLHRAFALAERFVPAAVFPEGAPTFQRALLTLA